MIFQEAGNVVDVKSWPLILDTDDIPKKKLTSIYRAPTPEMIAYLDFSVSTTGMLAGIKVILSYLFQICTFHSFLRNLILVACF